MDALHTPHGDGNIEFGAGVYYNGDALHTPHGDGNGRYTEEYTRVPWMHSTPLTGTQKKPSVLT